MYEQALVQVLIALGVGTFTSVMGKLANGSKWDNKKFAYTLGMTFVSGLVAVNAIEGGIDESNAIKVFLEVLGANFVIHTGIAIGSRLQGKSKIKA